MEKQLPLKGYRIMDFGMVLAGALATANLADMGAEVIKIESMHRLDTMRAGRPYVGDKLDPDQQPLHHNVNRGKLSFTVNIRDPRGQELLKRLVILSDGVVENMSPGTLARVGLDYPALKQLKPDLVMVSFSAAGQSGSYKEIIGYGPTMSALSGMDNLAGYYGEGVLGMHTSWPDMHAALSTAFALLAALRHRNRTGKGQYIDISQWEASSSLLGQPLLDFFMNGRVWGPQGNMSRHAAPHALYRCKGEDTWVAIAVETEDQWRSLCSIIEDQGAETDPRFSDCYQRVRHKGELDAIITEWTSRQTPMGAAQRLQEAGIPSAPCMELPDKLQDPHSKARGIFVDIEHPILGPEVISGAPWRLSKTPGGVRDRSPIMGEHVQYVAGDLLGLPADEISRLQEEQVLY